MKLIPVREFEWTDDYSFMRWMTCRNHPTARYLTKNPFYRSIHVLRFPVDTDGECPCPFDDLAVIVPDEPTVTDIVEQIADAASAEADELDMLTDVPPPSRVWGWA